jgi:diguanylate cyclase (GGDEF)-like protein/PAS domain S-box-containing protein
MSELQIDFKNIVEQSSDAIFITKAFPLEDPGPEIVYANNAYSRLNGLPVEEVIGKKSQLLKQLENDEEVALKIREALNSQQGTQVIYQKDKSPDEESWLELTIHPLADSNGEVTHFVVVERDISEQKQLEQQFDQLPKKDALTGLFSAEMFDEILSREFSLYCRTRNEYSILTLDIDRFKRLENYKDREKALIELAETMGIVFREYDLAARIGLDKFCILLRRTTLEQAFVSGIRFRQKVQQNCTLASDESNITVSVGVSQVLHSDTSYTDAQQRADTAMKESQVNGGDQVQLCREEIAIINASR